MRLKYIQCMFGFVKFLSFDLWLSEVIVITTKEVQKMISADPKKLDLKIKLDVEGIQDDSDMGTADALRHIQRKIKVRDLGQQKTPLLQSELVSSK